MDGSIRGKCMHICAVGLEGRMKWVGVYGDGAPYF